MPFDLTTFSEGVAALKTALDSVRSAYTMVKDFRSTGGSTEQEQKVIENVLTVASTNTAIAEATLGQAFGYEMCKCTLPPTPMLTVGYYDRVLHDDFDRRVADPVYECPKCGYNTAGPFSFKRTVVAPSGNAASSA
jgi:hypothetical protein